MSDASKLPRSLREFVDSENWTFAKTMPEWPHEYLVRDRVDTRHFDDLVHHIRIHGRPGRFYHRTLFYFEEDGYLFWTMVEKTPDGRRIPIESLRPGDMLRSVSLPGLRTDEPERVQYEWLSTWGLEGAAVRDARVAEIRIGEHNGFYVINGRIKATFEHPFLVRRDEEWGFCSAEMLAVGDYLITLVNGALDEERIESLERIDGAVRTVAIHVPGTNTYLAEGVWTHNDAKGSSGGTGLAPSAGSSGPGFSNSAGSSGDSGLTILTTGSSSSSSSSGSKSSGSSFSSSSIGISNTGASSSVAG